MEQEHQAKAESDRLAELLQLHNEMGGLDREINDRMTLRLQKSIRSGELLIEQKASLTPKHGKWGQWIKANLPYSQVTAERYMKLYLNKNKIFKLRILRLSEAYTAWTDPRERPEDVSESQEEWDSMRREWERIYAEKQNGKTTPPSQENDEGPAPHETSRY